MARSRKRSSTRRQWEWARSSGFYTGTVAGTAGYGAVDLLADARTRWGNAALRGATVSTVKGWIRPYYEVSSRVMGIAGIRVCSISDLEEVAANPEEAPFNDGMYEDWMAFLPYDLHFDDTTPAADLDATWNPANKFNLDVQSSRVLTDLGLTLGLFWYQAFVTGTAFANMDATLSVGLKLP